MLHFFIVMYGLSFTEAYTIKVSGQVELGNQLSKLFKELYSQFAENSPLPSESGSEPYNENWDDHSHSWDRDNGNGEYSGSNQGNGMLKRHRKKKVKDIPMLDKMMKNDLEQLHLYGHHNFEDRKNGDPLNNVNI